MYTGILEVQDRESPGAEAPGVMLAQQQDQKHDRVSNPLQVHFKLYP